MASDKDVLKLIDDSDSLRTRSSLNRWMHKHHDAFRDRLAARIANWDVLAELFAKAGLTDRLGNPPKPETARKMWQRVRKEVSEARSRRPMSRPTQRPTDPTTTPAPPPDSSAEPGGDLIRVMAEMSARGSKLPEPLK